MDMWLQIVNYILYLRTHGRINAGAKRVRKSFHGFRSWSIGNHCREHWNIWECYSVPQETGWIATIVKPVNFIVFRNL